MVLKINGKKSQKIDQPSAFDQHLTAEPAKAQTAVHLVTKNADGTKVEKLLKAEDEVVHPGIVSTDTLGSITVGSGMTVNIGNFESIRVDIKLCLPIKPSELEDGYEFVSNWVSSKMETIVKDLKGDNSGT